MEAFYEYYEFNGANFFTLVSKPQKEGRFPIVITRSPYVSGLKDKTEEELLEQYKKSSAHWAENGYVHVSQHCRGQGKSSGEFVPYVHEREDGLALREWIRKQSFYNGQIFLMGGSYTASLHYSTAPFEKDIVGAVFDVQDSERYRLWYRNGQMRRGHANWHFNLYKDKCGLNKTHSMESFSQLPLEGLSERVLGDRAEDFEQMLYGCRYEHPFWQTRFGGCEARDAVADADIPILLTTGYNDFYIGGMFRMWEDMTPKTKEKCAFIVTPYNHGQSFDAVRGIDFERASVAEKFGGDYHLKWFNAILKNEKPFVKTGVITYYRAFDNKWEENFYFGETEETEIKLGTEIKTMVYHPENPPAFVPEGIFMDSKENREDVITIYTKPFERDVFVKGQMKARLTVETDCEDTSFYIMVGIETEKGDYSLRHDITSLLYQKEAYKPGTKTTLDFSFDEYAFLLKRGQRLRVDIAPSDKNTYVCHTNQKGEYSLIENCRTANNKVYLDESFIVLPVEKK